MVHLKFPIALEIDLNYKCNFKCLYCRNGGVLHEKEELPPSLFKQIIEECKMHGLFSLKISGGEPLLYSHFDEILEVLKESNLNWNLISNGSLITEEKAKLLKRANCKSVYITLTGVDDETDGYHKNFPKSFSMVDKAIRNLKQNDIVVTLGFLFTNRNKHSINKLVDYAQELDLSIKPMRMEPLGNALKNDYLSLSEEEYENIVKEIRSKLPNKVLVSEDTTPFYEIDCEAGKIACVISAKGEVYPCVMFIGSDIIGGNVNNSSLYDIWNNSEIFKKFREPVQFEKTCFNCSKKLECKKGCKGRAYLVSKNFSRIDGRCINDM